MFRLRFLVFSFYFAGLGFLWVLLLLVLLIVLLGIRRWVFNSDYFEVGLIRFFGFVVLFVCLFVLVLVICVFVFLS